MPFYPDPAPRSNVTSKVPECWVSYMKSIYMQSSNSNATCVAFCHSRISTNGHVGLVVVEFAPDYRHGERLLNVMSAITGKQLELQSDDRVIHPPDEASSPDDLPFPRKVFAGQIDPTDSSRFTIEYEWPNGVRGVIDGQLLADDSVSLEIRKGPGDIESAEDSYTRHPEQWKK